MRKLITALLILVLLQKAYPCSQCDSDDSLFVNLPQTCLNEITLIIENSNAYGPRDLKRILPFIRKANKHFYRCGNYDVATGDDITVIVDRETGIIYLTRYVYKPEEEQ